MEYYDRYKNYRNDTSIDIVRFSEIPKNNTDIYIVFNKNNMRMDTLSYKYYNDPNYGWLILMANPHLPSMEFSIPDGITLRIPYPLSTAIKGYETMQTKYLKQTL